LTVLIKRPQSAFRPELFVSKLSQTFRDSGAGDLRRILLKKSGRGVELMDYKSLGMRIRKRRKAMHMTQEELAKKLGLSLSFLGHIERGTRKASVETLVAIANELSLSVDYMLQDSLSENVLQKTPASGRQRVVLEEISKLITDNLEEWDN
jgi:transcriptional regulator with XRE-family HTH domain